MAKWQRMLRYGIAVSLISVFMMMSACSQSAPKNSVGSQNANDSAAPATESQSKVKSTGETMESQSTAGSTDGSTNESTSTSSTKPSDDYAFSEAPNPMSIGLTLSPKSVSKLMTSEGGTIDVKGTSDIQLKLAKNSLDGAREISIIPINSIVGTDKAWTFVAGAQLTPDGTKFPVAGELRIKIPASYANKKLMGFSYEGEGKDFSFYPITIVDGSAVFMLYGFSG